MVVGDVVITSGLLLFIILVIIVIWLIKRV